MAMGTMVPYVSTVYYLFNLGIEPSKKKKNYTSYPNTFNVPCSVSWATDALTGQMAQTIFIDLLAHFTVHTSVHCIYIEHCVYVGVKIWSTGSFVLSSQQLFVV